MKSSRIIVSLLFATFVIGMMGCRSSLLGKKPKAKPPSITSFFPHNPILKRADANPLLRVSVFIPAGQKTISFKTIHCTINDQALSDVDKIDVYFTKSEPLFSTGNLAATIKPSSPVFDIPVDMELHPGMNYIWFSATLQQNANIDNIVELHASGFSDSKGNREAVSDEGGHYQKRLGIALRKAGDDNVNTYRIPGIATTDRGTLIAVYDIRYNNAKDLPEDIDVGMNRSTDGGKTWHPMKVIMDMGEPHADNGIGDPAILFDPVTKKIWVAALWSKGNRSIGGSIGGISPDSTGQFMLASSDDDGNTWSAPINITAQIKDPKWKIMFQGPGTGIAMQNGNLVFPAQYWDENNMPHSTIIYSEDHGKTWKNGIGAKSNTTESAVVETTPGTLMLNMRDNRGSWDPYGGFRTISTTTDFGKTWTEHPTSYNTLQDPVCMGSLIKAKVNVKGVMQDVLFFSNANNSFARNDISIKASLDLGQTWLPANELLIDERKCYGYSALTKIDDNTIGLLYEGIKDLYFVRVPVGEIIR